MDQFAPLQIWKLTDASGDRYFRILHNILGRIACEDRMTGALIEADEKTMADPSNGWTHVEPV